MATMETKLVDLCHELLDHFGNLWENYPTLEVWYEGELVTGVVNEELLEILASIREALDEGEEDV